MSNYDHRIDWYYEGNISRAIVKFLKLQDYKIIKDNSEKISERGEDIIASKYGVNLIVEVKGYPTEFLTNGVNKGQKKRTNPKQQAKHWLSEAIFTLMRSYSKHKGDKMEIALGLPKHPRYDELIAMVKPFFADSRIPLKVFLVDELNVVTTEILSK
jgi:Holliday junction resolvase-like predicted endonuclease